MSNYYVNDRKLVGNGSNEECILTQYNNSHSNLSNCLNVGTDIFEANLGPNYKIDTINTLSFYKTNYAHLKCTSSGYTSTDANGITTDITQNGLISYRIHNAGTSGHFSTSGANKLNVLLIGGGGGGAATTRSNNFNRYGKGGGGAGGLILFTANDLTSSSSYFIQIGDGGTGGITGEDQTSSNQAKDGSPSSFNHGGNNITAYGGTASSANSNPGLGGEGGNVTSPFPTNYSQLISRTYIHGRNGEMQDNGSGWGGRGGVYSSLSLDWSYFPIVIRTIASPSNTSFHPTASERLIAQNNYGYSEQATNGYGVGGGGAGGSNRGSSTHMQGANGGNGLGIVFFRYD